MVTDDYLDMVLRSCLDSPGQVRVNAPPIRIKVAENISTFRKHFYVSKLTILLEIRLVKLDKETCSEEWSGVCCRLQLRIRWPTDPT